MKLKNIDADHINNIRKLYEARSEGDKINLSLEKLFRTFDDESSYEEVQIKVAALNHIYSTSIKFIKPLVKKITEEVSKKQNYTEEELVALADTIANIEWTSSSDNKTYKRNYLSFASKYIHFFSKYKMPIYDSYIWIIMVGYFIQKGNNTYFFNKPPKSYKDFYSIFYLFRKEFDMDKYTVYETDKFLWMYGKYLIEDIMEKNQVDLDKAKRILQEQIKNSNHD